MDVLLILLVVLGLGISLMSVVTAVRKLLWLHLPREGARAATTVILPLTGAASDLPELVGLLRAQTLRPRRLIITVESQDDPAFARAAGLPPNGDFPIEIVVAGHATHQAQKCRNQQAALARIDADDAVIVLMDGDIRPASYWLAALVAPVEGGDFDIVTAHRWLQVTRCRLGAHCVAAIDRAITLSPRMDHGATRVVWGGSMAISRAASLQMDLSASLERTLSDDLSIARAASEAGLRMVTRGALLVASPTDQPFLPAWRFARRQYQICNIYRPWLWRLALAIIPARLGAWGAALWLTLNWGGAWSLGLASLAALGLLKQYLVADVARRVGMPDPASARLVQLALGILQPVPDLFHASVVLGAAWTRTVRWGHVTYDVTGPDRILVKERRPFSG